MVDLHSHILFNIDDGAENIEEAVALLERAKRAGVKKLMLTPHFTMGSLVEEFVNVRDKNLERLKAEFSEIELKAGAEVYITDELFNEDNLNQLTMGESKVILCEFKYHNLKAEKFLDYIDYITEEGFIPLVAHVERYSFVRENPLLLKAMLDRQVLLQVNAISLFEDNEEGEFARFLFNERLIFAVGSDMHHEGSKRYRAMEAVRNKKTEYTEKILWENPLSVFENTLKIGDE